MLVVNLQKTVTRLLPGALAPANLGAAAEFQLQAGRAYEIRAADAAVSVRDGAPPLGDRDTVIVPSAPLRIRAQGTVLSCAAYGANDARVYVSELTELPGGAS